MAGLSFEYAKNRFLNPAKVIDASIYEKQSKDVDPSGNYPQVIRVAISMDTENKDKSTLYSDAMPTLADARKFIGTVPGQE